MSSEMISGIDLGLDKFLIIGMILGVYRVTSSILRPFVGGASDRNGRKGFVVIGLLLLIPFTLMQGLARQQWQMVVARGLQGISAAMILAPALALVGDLSVRGGRLGLNYRY